MDSWSGAQMQNLSVVIYHTLFPTMRSNFIRRASKGRKEKDWRENLKTLFYKGCSLGYKKTNN